MQRSVVEQSSPTLQQNQHRKNVPCMNHINCVCVCVSSGFCSHTSEVTVLTCSFGCPPPSCPVHCAAEGEREPRGLGRRRRPRAADAGAGLPADGPHVAAGQEQDGLHPHRLRRAARHALHRAPDGVRWQRRAATVQPRPGEHVAGRVLRLLKHGLCGCLRDAARRHRRRPPPRPCAKPDDRLVGCVLVSRTNSAGGRGGTLLIQVFCSSC